VCVVEVRGVTQLHNVVYVVYDNSSTIDTFTADTLSPLGERIHVEGMRRPNDIVACRHDRQLYVADVNYCIWRVSADDHSYVKWLPTESTTDTFSVWKLSLTSQHLLVTSHKPPGLRQYSTTDKQLLRVVVLPSYMEALHHAVETTRQTFVVCHVDTSEDKEQCAVSELFRFCHVLVNYQ